MALWQRINMEKKKKRYCRLTGKLNLTRLKQRKTSSAGVKKKNSSTLRSMLSSRHVWNFLTGFQFSSVSNSSSLRSNAACKWAGRLERMTGGHLAPPPSVPAMHLPPPPAPEKKNRAPINASSSILDFYPKYVYITNIPRKLLGHLDN